MSIQSFVTPFVVLVFAVLLYHALHELQLRIESVLSTHVSSTGDVVIDDKRRVAWIGGEGENIATGHMKHIFEAFDNFNYKIITGCPPKEEWDVLWLHEYALSKTQRCYHDEVNRAEWPKAVNHIAGSGYYTSKVYLATTDLPFGVPLAFKLPSEADKLKKYAAQHPEVRWVQKDNGHRNIHIKKIEDVDFEQSNSFVQQFVDNPLLIDDRKFDLGIYTVVTSLDPLKVYTFEDVLIRFCPKDYNPFDENDVDKYVVGDDYTPLWEIKSLSPFYNDNRLSVKETMNAYLKSKGKDGGKIWRQVQAVIAEVFQAHQDKMIRSRPMKGTDPKFFELSRFDFVVDDELNVYLMEANMSPNLSSGHFIENQLLYEQVLMSVFSLVGLASPLTKTATDKFRTRPRSQFAPVSDRDISLEYAFCIDCSLCDAEELCALCGHCLKADDELTDVLGETVREHLERRKMRRVALRSDKAQTRLDRLLSVFVEAKCERDSSWC